MASRRMKKTRITAKIARKTPRVESYQKAVKLFGRYARQMHVHGRPGITSAHDARHVATVSMYAERLAKFLGATPKEQALAAIAGQTHDRIRVASEKLIDRTQAIELLKKEFPSGSESKAVQLADQAFAVRKRLKSVSDYTHTGGGITSDELTATFLKDKFRRHLSQTATARVLKAIRLAGQMPSKKGFRKDLVHSGLVFADKFFEANGAFIAFRRAYFMGEREDRRKEMRDNGLTPAEAAVRITLDETKKRIKAFSDLSKIPGILHPFVRYQVEWQERLKQGLEERKPWAVHLASALFQEGLKYKTSEQPRSLEETIRNYAPVSEEDARFKEETLRYFNGDLWNTFIRLVRVPSAVRKR